MFYDVLAVIDFMGIVAFAFAGILAAENKKVDPVGVFVLAFVTAFGGGIMRDLLVDRRPFYWISHWQFIYVVIALVIIAPYLIRKFKIHIPYALFIWLDAIGMALFAVSGTAIALEAEIPWLPATMLGVCTGVFGGLIRDVFLNELPSLLYDRQPYAVSAFIGSALYVLLGLFNCNQEFMIVVSILVVIAIRMTCWHMKWNIISYGKSQDSDGIFRSHTD